MHQAQRFLAALLFPVLLPVPSFAFHFCVSTAAHQIEGHNTNTDWWQWEQLHGKIADGSNSAVTTDSWNHVREDIAHMKEMGVDTYRFSIEWASIEPKEGEFDFKQIDRYLSLIRKLRAHGITPMVTLYHFTLPIWVSNKGGWEWDGITTAFERYVTTVANRVHEKAPHSIELWTTLNEPMTLIAAGYISKEFPPGKDKLDSIKLPMLNMVKAHARAYHVLHNLLDDSNFKIKVGLAHHLRVFEPLDKNNILDQYIKSKFDEIFNWAFTNAVYTGHLEFKLPFVVDSVEFVPEATKTQDFFGLNYYTRNLVAFEVFSGNHLRLDTKKNAPLTDLKWEIYPEGMGLLLDRIHRDYKELPIWITENGIADATDAKRAQFISDHLDQIRSRVKSKSNPDGMDIEGYCHWTLNDNFEWIEGYSAKFGLYSTDPKTQARTPRKSAEEFKRLISEFKASL